MRVSLNLIFVLMLHFLPRSISGFLGLPVLWILHSAINFLGQPMGMVSGKTEFNYDSQNQLLLKKSYIKTTSNSWDLHKKVDFVNTFDNKNKLLNTKLYENIKSVPDTREYKLFKKFIPNALL